MTQNIFDQLSHTDFLKLTLEAFSRQGYEVERSSAAGADCVLVGRQGARVAVLTKKYRGAFIGRPVLQQFYAAMEQTGCNEGRLITTTDCSPDAYEFAKGKNIELYNLARTTELLRTAFGDEFIKTGRMPELGAKARTIPAAARPTISIASYEKVPVVDERKASEPDRPAVLVQTPEQEQPPTTGEAWEPEGATVTIAEPEPARGPGPESKKELAAEAPAAAPELEDLLPEPAVGEEPAEEVDIVENIGAPDAPDPSPRRTGRPSPARNVTII